MEAAVKLGRAARLDPAVTGLYQPRRPQGTILYKLIQENLETFLARAREACIDDDPIPAYVESAAHLVDHVIPRVPIRQWVLTVPKRVRPQTARTANYAAISSNTPICTPPSRRERKLNSLDMIGLPAVFF